MQSVSVWLGGSRGTNLLQKSSWYKYGFYISNHFLYQSTHTDYTFKRKKVKQKTFVLYTVVQYELHRKDKTRLNRVTTALIIYASIYRGIWLYIKKAVFSDSGAQQIRLVISARGSLYGRGPYVLSYFSEVRCPLVQ